MSTSLATKNVATILVAASLVLGFAFAFATPAKADTLSNLQAQVQALLAQIAALQGGSSSGGSASCAVTFTRNLKLGSSGSEVMAVQKFLNSKGFTVAASGAGSPGNESTYFGAKTKAAVIKFQDANAATILTPVGLTNGTGNWFASTRAAANAQCSTTGGTTGGTTGTTGGTTPTGSGITVTAGAQPANSLAPQGAVRVPFTSFTLTNNTGSAVTINGITIQRTGLAADAAFASAVLIDSNGLQVGNTQTFDSNHNATVGGTITLNPGQSMTYTVAGNMAASESSYSGQIASISVTGVNSSVPVSGTLPITGAQQTVNSSLTIGTVTTQISPLDPNSATNKPIGSTGVKFTAVRFTAGSGEDLKLYSIRWRLNGSASLSDLGNLATVVSGTSYPGVVSADGRYVTSTFPGGILVSKGNSVDIYIQGDLTGTNSAGRIVEFDVDKTSDVYFVGQLYGYGIAMAYNSTGTASTASTHATTYTSSGNPVYQGSTVSIQAGTVTTIQNATSVSSANIPVNVPNTTLGGFQTNFAGEPVTVSGLKLYITSSGTTSVSEVTGVSLVNQNGVVVAGPVDASGSIVNFTNSITFPVGSMTYTVKGKIPSTGWPNGATIQLNTTPSGWTSPTGQSTGNSITISTGNFTMNTQTIQAGSLKITAGATPASQNVVAGVQNVPLANIQLDASQSGEDMRISSLILTHTGTESLGYLSGCVLMNGATQLNTGSNVVNTVATTTTVTFDNALTIPKGTVTTLGFQCNLSSSATTGTGETLIWGVNAANTITATGVQSGTSVTVTPTTGNSGTMTVSTGASVTVTAASSVVAQPALAQVAAGTTGVTIGQFKVRSSNEGFNLQKLGLTLANGTYGTASTGSGGSSASGVGDVTNVYIYQGSTLVGTATFTGSSQTATSTFATPIAIARDIDTYFTLKADTAQIGVSASAGIGDQLAVDPLNFQGVGASSGNTVTGGATAGVNGVLLFKSAPTVAFVSNSTNPTGTNATLKRFTISAGSAGPVGIYQLQFAIATSGASVSSLKLYAYTDSGYSQGVSSQGSGTGQIGSTACSSGCTSNPTAQNFTASTPVEIPASTTYYFALLGTITGQGTNTNWTISPTLNGDAYRIQANGGVNATTTAGAVATSSAFIWSDNATTTSGTTQNDWFNGFQVPGLPSTGI